MLRIIIILAVFISCTYLLGCGGSSSGDSDLADITIQSDRVSPKNVTVAINDRVQWLNTSSRPVQVISGTLEQSGSPQVEHIIEIRSTGFVPSNFEADYGERLRFNNLTTGTFDLEVVDTGGGVVSSQNVSSGLLSDPIDFQAAGKYFFRKRSNTLFSGTVILFGEPNPSGQFQSPVLANGGSFSAQFDVQEFIPYFILDVNNPGRSFITGSIMVQ